MDASNLEPTDVGPAAGGDVPATRADREHATVLLNAACAEGYLSGAERDRRVAAAQVASTFDDLVPLTRDLLDIRSAGLATVPPTIDSAGATDDVDSIVNIFSGTTREGRWRVRRRISMLACFGGTTLDTRDAVFEAQTIDVNVFMLFGGLDLTVPVGCDVQDSVGAIFGGVDRKLAAPAPGMPVFNLHGFVAFGGVSVHNPK